MPNPAILVGGLISGISAKTQANAANKASNAQSASAEAGIAEQRRQFDTVRQLLQPYVNVGKDALIGQKDALGLNGAAAQQGFISGVDQSPQFGAIVQQGENAILSNASATGGLRGGNTQAALGQFRPQMLSQLLEQQYSRLGGLSAQGQNAAAGVGNAAQSTGNNIAGLMQQQGAAQAGGALAQGQAAQGFLSGIGGLVGQFGGFQPNGTMNVGKPNSLFGNGGF